MCVVHTPRRPPYVVAVALLELTLRVYYMLPKRLRGHVLSKEDADELKGKAREFKSVLNVVATFTRASWSAASAWSSA